MDELSFDVGETINVVEYDDPEEQVRIGPFIPHRITGVLVRALASRSSVSVAIMVRNFTLSVGSGVSTLRLANFVYKHSCAYMTLIHFRINI